MMCSSRPMILCSPVGAHNSVVGADQGFRAPSWDQESVQDSVHEDSTSARIAAGQLPRPSFRHPQANNLIKRVKRAAFGFTNFDNYRIRALLYAGKPNWALLETLTPT